MIVAAGAVRGWRRPLLLEQRVQPRELLRTLRPHPVVGRGRLERPAGRRAPLAAHRGPARPRRLLRHHPEEAQSCQGTLLVDGIARCPD